LKKKKEEFCEVANGARTRHKERNGNREKTNENRDGQSMSKKKK